MPASGVGRAFVALFTGRSVRVMLAALWVVTGAQDLRAQAGGAIEGSVLSTADSLPVRQATVQVTRTQLGVLTGESGSFRIVRVVPGTYAIQITAPGFESKIHSDVKVTQGTTARVVVYVRPSVINVPGLVVTA
ncbi:MAG: carboxypeptidase-like regulatory domain-containing protein, partial [Gemmatimonadetes bacterium]|nr:carboxypeptidase-like regulatory domain-containing protein [Gemmatimonadota bacterium]NNK48391.1 hypothetical protein [Gemmatimonadota bacterium]